MVIQAFWDGGTELEMPKFVWGNGERTAEAITGLYYIAATDSLVARFDLNRKQLALENGTLWGRKILQKVWRGGQITQIGGDVPQIGIGYYFPFWYGGDVPTNDGRLLQTPLMSGPQKGRYNFIIEDAASAGVSAGSVSYHQNYYTVDPLWPGNIIIPGKVADAWIMSPNGVGFIDPANRIGYSIETSGSNFMIVSHFVSGATFTSSVVFGPVITGGGGADLSFKPARGLVYVDASTTIAYFGAAGGDLGGPLASSPGIIRVFDTKINTGQWTLIWEDELPGNGLNVAYDTANQVLYSIGFHASQAILHASKLKRTPMVFASASIKGTTQTELVPLVQTTLSTIVTHGCGGQTGHISYTSFLSNELLLWTLDSDVDSRGSLVSAYSLTDDDGSSTITYLGPASPDPGLTERVNICVAEVARC
jgi:hypothetical protein